MRMLLAAEEFHVPTVTELFEFVPFATFHLAGIEFRVTFPMILMYVLVLLVGALFFAGFGRAQVVPAGLQNFLEGTVDLLREQIVQPVLGADGERWIPFLTSMFAFIFALNLMEIMPLINFPITSRMAIPAFLALLSLIIFNVVGIKEQGFIPYFKGMLFPPGVPKPIYIILTPVEVLSTIVFRPLTLAVRLFANMMAGHVLLAIFFLASAYFLYRSDSILLTVLSPFPFIMSVVLIGFELFISLIQAFIFTILTAVYIDGALHPEH